MENITITIKKILNAEQIKNLLDEASRGARYWCSDAEELAYESATNAIVEGGMIMLHDAENDGKAYELTLKEVERGLTVMAEKYPKHFGDIFEDSDADTGDVFLQCALLGDVIYG